MSDESTIVDQYFYTTRPYLGECLFSEGFCGWVECEVGSDKYLIHTLREKSIQHIVESDFFMEARAQFFYELDDLKEARKAFLKGGE
jgi:hypothetical protein